MKIFLTTKKRLIMVYIIHHTHTLLGAYAYNFHRKEMGTE